MFEPGGSVSPLASTTRMIRRPFLDTVPEEPFWPERVGDCEAGVVDVCEEEDGVWEWPPRAFGGELAEDEEGEDFNCSDALKLADRAAASFSFSFSLSFSRSFSLCSAGWKQAKETRKEKDKTAQDSTGDRDGRMERKKKR